MNVSNVTSATNSYTNPYQTNFRQGVQDFQSLASALQSGNLSGAQSAFSSLEQDLPGISQVLQAGANSSASGTSTNPIGQALQSLSSALQSGDISGAQQAFASLQQGLQATQGTGHAHRGHHHHHSSGVNGSNGTNQTSNTDSDGDSDGSSSTTTTSTGSPAASFLNAQA